MGAPRLWSILALLLSVVILRIIMQRDYSKFKKRSIENNKKDNNIRHKFRVKASQRIDLFMDYVKTHMPIVCFLEAKRIFPRKYEVHGHVVVARMNTGVTPEQFSPFAEAFSKSFLPILINVVLVETKGIEGELRIPTLVTVYSDLSPDFLSYSGKNRGFILKKWKECCSKGINSYVSEEELDLLLENYFRSDTMTVHKENNIYYSFDVRKVMFSSGNTTERMHFANVDASNEIVVDMFAGIGYFTIPIAVHGSPSVVYALEKNPDSVAFLKLNSVQNCVSHIVKPKCGDNRLIGDELQGRCDRVLMGYIPCCKIFLKRAVFFLKKSEGGFPAGIIHYHFLSDKENPLDIIYLHIKEELGDLLTSIVKVKGLRCVKSYAPKRFHFVADLSFS